MKISQAVLLLASSSSAEKVDVDITRELYLTPTEDGLRTGNLNLLITQPTWETSLKAHLRGISGPLLHVDSNQNRV